MNRLYNKIHLQLNFTLCGNLQYICQKLFSLILQKSHLINPTYIIFLMVIVYNIDYLIHTKHNNRMIK